MNAIFCSATETDVILQDISAETEDRYATVPLSIVVPKQPAVDEDTLHASFDAALSHRLTALHNHWNGGSSQHTQLDTTESRVAIQPSVSTEPLTSCTAQSAYVWPQRIIYSCLVLILLMVGFDLMGLLVLHTH